MVEYDKNSFVLPQLCWQSRSMIMLPLKNEISVSCDSFVFLARAHELESNSYFGLVSGPGLGLAKVSEGEKGGTTTKTRRFGVTLFWSQPGEDANDSKAGWRS